MAITFSWSSVTDIGGSGTGPQTFSHTFSGEGAAVLLATRMGTAPPTAVTVGGVSLVQQDTGFNVTPQLYGTIWAVASGVPSGSQTVSITVANAQTCQFAIAVDVTNPGRLLAIGDANSDGSGSGGTFESVTSAVAARGVACMAVVNGASVTAGTGCTIVDSGIGGTFESDGYFAEEDAEVTGTRSIGFTFNNPHAGSVLLFEDAGVPPTLQAPDPPGAEVGIPDTFEVTQGPPNIASFAIGGAEVGIPSGFRVSATGSAQVLLAVPRQDRPQMTESGTEGQVLTYHTSRKPSWEDASGGSDLSSLVIDTASGTYDIDAAVAATHEITLTDATELTPVGTSAADETIDLRLVLFPEEETVTWGGTILWAGGSEPDLSGLGAGESVVIGFLSTDEGATWRGFLAVPGGVDTDDQTAAEVPFTPAGTIAATDTQAAVEEVSGDVAAHLSDATDAHDASAISIVDSGGHFTGTDVESALQELGSAPGGDPGDDTHVWMPLTTVIDGVPELVWDEPSLGLIPTLVPLE